MDRFRHFKALLVTTALALGVGLQAAVPSITTPPAPQTVSAGFAATFSVTAAGTAPLSYQWYRKVPGGSSYSPIAGATASSHTTPVTTLADNGAGYYVLVSNAEGAVYSGSVPLTVKATPVFTRQPASQTIYEGNTILLTAAAQSSSTLSWQWQRKRTTDSSWANLAGATSATYTSGSGAWSEDNGAQYRVVATNASGSTTSAIATVTVRYIDVSAGGAGPTTSGHTLTFTGSATGNPSNITLQWYGRAKNATSYSPIPGATSTSYTTPPLTLADNGSAYFLRASNGYVTAQSLPFSITVTPSVKISAFTPSTTAIVGGPGSATLTATFSGGPGTTATVDHGVGALQNNVPASTGTLNQTTTFTLTVTDPGTGDTATATTTIKVTTAAPTISSLTATPSSILNGQSSTVAWTLDAHGPLTGLSLNGVDVQNKTSLLVQPSATTVYTLLATNAMGSTSSQVTVTVNTVPRISAFSASATLIHPGDSASLYVSFSGTGATGSVDQGIGAVTSGTSVETGPLSATRTYTLTVTGSYGNPATATATIAVSPGTFTVLNTLQGPDGDRNHTAVQLMDGRTLVHTGRGQQNVSDPGYVLFQLYDYRNDSITYGPTGLILYNFTATPLDDGRVLLAGGYHNTALTASGRVYDPVTNTIANVGNLVVQRVGHTATRLLNGKVLLAGGAGNSAELFNPATGTFSPTGNMRYSRTGHTATLLPNGKVLMVGGSSAPQTAEIYDPATGAFTASTAPGAAHTNQAAVMLGTGKVLITGPTCELYDPATDTYTNTGSWDGRVAPALTLMADGNVLMTGGKSSTGYNLATTAIYVTGLGVFRENWALASAPTSPSNNTVAAVLLPDHRVFLAGGDGYGIYQVYDPHTAPLPLPTAWTPGPTMGHGRYLHTATLLGDGRVLLAGGTGGGTSADIFSPDTGTMSPAGSSLLASRTDHRAVMLPSGKVLVVGGDGPTTATPTAEWYDPGLSKFTPAPAPNTIRYGAMLVPLKNGKLLYAGGYNGSTYYGTAEVFDPVAGTWTPTTTTMGALRGRAAACLLPNGKVLICGGRSDGSSARSDAEIYDPVTNSFSPSAGTMAKSRYLHTATLLPNGKVLVAGASGGTDAAPEYYDWATDTFSPAPTFGPALRAHAAVVAPWGGLLITGGFDTATSTYLDQVLNLDPVAGSVSTLPHLNAPREYHTSTVLPDGRILVTGGYTPATGALSSTEILH